MVVKRPVSWFLTESGRRFTFGLATATGLGCTVAKFAPHTFMLNYYKDFVRFYSNGKPAELPKELCNRCQECLDILNLSDIYRKLVQPFSVFGYDLFHAGSSFSKFGMAVGIPVNFTYKSLADIEKDVIQVCATLNKIIAFSSVNMKKVDWESETGKKLADALILPEKVQKFAICREILMTQNKKAIYEAVYPFTSIFLVYNLASYLNKRLNLYVAPVAVRGVMYSIVGLFGLGTYFLMKDMTEVYYECQVDKKLCELGEEFIESGVIFYDKILKRNQALRELMGKEGERKYSKLGNENFGIRQPRIALVHRKQFFESQLRDNRKEDLEILENSV